ncbi:hypothetical protein CBS147354_7022 [Penicillium roqueforti]|nr:hypothetical protein CBS147354_7022 [Penicillium roqueforti]
MSLNSQNKVGYLIRHEHHHGNSRAYSSGQSPSVSRTGLPPSPSAASTLQWQRRLFQGSGYSHHRRRDDPAAGNEQRRPRETVDRTLQELNPAFAPARREETFSLLRPCTWRGIVM